ncbi:MAG TPA: hypothetical protein VFH95_09415 [Candidatus Kapabacteria bacterium]|nr:hypothetical protein [Candidatus Kapabacteria bacterium]
MKTLILVILALALGFSTPRAQGRGHAYGRYKQHGPPARVYSAPRVYYTHPVYTAPRVYYYRPRPSISFSFPFGYSTYQPYSTYYYPNGYIASQRYRIIRERREREEREHRFAHERRER